MRVRVVQRGRDKKFVPQYIKVNGADSTWENINISEGLDEYKTSYDTLDEAKKVCELWMENHPEDKIVWHD